MLKEKGRIVAIHEESLLVETIQRSTCGSCVAKQGCGQALLSRIGVKPTYLHVLLAGRDPGNYNVNDDVTIAIPNDIVVKSSLLVYLIPLFLMLVFTGVAHTYSVSEFIVILAGIMGFVLGGLFIRRHAWNHRNDERYHPMLIDDNVRSPELILKH